MFRKIKGFIMGVIVTVILMTTGTAIASTVRTINVTYRNIRIVVGGEEITLRDVQGNAIEPFIFEGTTYLPVRAVAEALGQTVNWDGATSTVYIGNESTQSPPMEQNIQQTMPAGQILAGVWNWFGSPYYVFGADGQGTMAGEPIRWKANNGILTICITPELCGSNCTASVEWYYAVAGNQLTLTSILLPGLSFIYTRG